MRYTTNHKSNIKKLMSDPKFGREMVRKLLLTRGINDGSVKDIIVGNIKFKVKELG